MIEIMDGGSEKVHLLIEMPERDYNLAHDYPEALIGSYAEYIRNGTILKEKDLMAFQCKEDDVDSLQESEAVSRDEVLMSLTGMITDEDTIESILARCIRRINKLPAIRPKGRDGIWVLDEEQEHVELTYHCSECGSMAWGEAEKSKYCPDCGAKMKRERKEDGKNGKNTR